MSKQLYLLPGTMCDQRLWLPMIDEYKNIAHVSCQFNHLEIGRQASIDDIVEHIKHQLPNKKVSLFGFSLGGYLACAFALKYPQLIKQLFVVSSMPCVLPDKEIKERTRAVAWIKKNGYQGISNKRVLTLLAENAQANVELINLIKVMDKSLGEEAILHQLLTTTKREDLYKKLAELRFRKDFCTGEDDKIVSAQFLHRIKGKDNHMTLTVFEKTGHMLPLEQPKKLASWINGLLMD